jgi:hypothetical protein
MALPFFVSHWGDHDNSLFELGESVSFQTEEEVYKYIQRWQDYASDGINMLEKCVVTCLLVSDFRLNDRKQTIMESRFIDL